MAGTSPAITVASWTLQVNAGRRNGGGCGGRSPSIEVALVDLTSLGRMIGQSIHSPRRAWLACIGALSSARPTAFCRYLAPFSVLGGLSSLALAGALLHAQPGGSVAEFDVILRHGTIINGTGTAGYPGDVGVKNGYIANIGDLSYSRARLDLDVTGLIVSPRFINIHSHAEPDAPKAENMLMQGVTTEILGPDGSGPSDIAE